MENESNKTNANSLTSAQWWRDFFSFKIMLISEITKVVFILGVIGILFNGFITMKLNMVLGIGLIIGGIIGLRMILELVTVLFSILDMLRDIRNKLPEPKKADAEQKM